MTMTDHARRHQPPLFVLASVNIERRNHLDRLDRFITDIEPDILCVQEAMHSSLGAIASSGGFTNHHFAPMALHPDEAPGDTIGVAVFSKHIFTAAETIAYFGEGDGTQVLDRTDAYSRLRTASYCLAVARIDAGNAPLAIATTHFPWTPDGSERDFQFEAVDNLIDKLDTQAPLALCGDFNAPRGGPIFARLAERWRDNIPANETSSLDPELHRVGNLPFMVDGLFTTPSIAASNVRLHTGVSDHRAMSATLEVASA